MKTIWSISLIGAALILILALDSCSGKACYDDTNPLLNTSLLANGTGHDTSCVSLIVKGMTATDTIDFVDTKSVSFFSVPLDPGNDVTTFYIVLNGITDTAVITYERSPHLVSAECGYTFVSELTGLKTTHNIIDTLMIENNSVNLNGKRNLHLFF
ncbi:MAG: DUF6452 family protein [Bacteroidales bacterium]